MRFMEKTRDYYIKKAEETFGTTSNFYVAGYLLADGKLLNFGSYGQRVFDHRDIGQIFENEASGFNSDNFDGNYYLKKFMNMGNIRLIPEYPGIEVSVKPNRRQEMMLVSIITRCFRDYGSFSLDISDKDNDNQYLFNREYNLSEGNYTAYDVIDDIEKYLH